MELHTQDFQPQVPSEQWVCGDSYSDYYGNSTKM